MTASSSVVGVCPRLQRAVFSQLSLPSKFQVFVVPDGMLKKKLPDVA